MEPKYFQEQIFFLTVRIEATDPDTDRQSVGTGFLITEPVDESHSVTLLVTCRHVLFEGDGAVTLQFNKRNPRAPRELELGETIKVGPATYESAYVGHSDPNVDVAAINISSVIRDFPDIFFKFLSRDQVADFSEERLVPTLDVLFVGYPLGLYDTINNFPVARSGHCATHPRVDFNGLPEFLIDAQVFPGSSGSPVFVRLGNAYLLCGMVGRQLSREVPVEQRPAGWTYSVQDHIGLGVVYKPDAIYDVVADAVASRNRNG